MLHLVLKIFFICLCIKSLSAFYRFSIKCSYKRITCFDDVSYKFCFNTTSSSIAYGNLRYCPKGTVCDDNEGIKACINKKNKPDGLTLDNINRTVSDLNYTTFDSLTISSVLTKDNRFISTTEENLGSTFSTSSTYLTKHILSTPPGTTSKPNTISQINKIQKTTTIPLFRKVIPLRKRKKPTTKSPKLQNKKRRRKPIYSALSENLIKLKRKYSHKRKSTTESPNLKMVNKKPLVLSTKTKKPSKIAITKKKPINKEPPQHANNSPLKTSKISTQINNEIKLSTPFSENNVKNIVTDNISSISSIRPAIDHSSYSSSDTIVVTTWSSTTKSEALKTSIPKISHFEATQPTLLSTINSITKPISLKTTTMPQSLKLTTTSPYYLPSISVTPNPCNFYKEWLKFSKTSTSRLSTIISTSSTTEHPSVCKAPAKYPSKKCNEYYECKMVMWWYKWLTLKCKRGFAFDKVTLQCVEDFSCKG